MIKCKVCGKLKKYYAKEMCEKCYNKERNKKYTELHHEEKLTRDKKYYEDHREIILERDRIKYENLSTSGGSKTNKDCASYLGVYIAEQLLSNVFKTVQHMPNCNPGYDFICGKGFRVDVKSGCIYKSKEQSEHWQFKIRHNKIADFFLCIAFDNRIDMNPLHLWLIPGNILSHLSATNISKSTIEKWSEYEQSLDKVLECCNTMKGDK